MDAFSADVLRWVISGCVPMITGAAIYAAKSIHDLNLKVAVVVEKVAHHDDRFERQDRRIDRLEERVV